MSKKLLSTSEQALLIFGGAPQKSGFSRCESVEIAQSPTSKAKRNTMKRGAVTSAEIEAVGRATEHQMSPEIEDQIEILTGNNHECVVF